MDPQTKRPISDPKYFSASLTCSPITEGALPGIFSVSPTKRVRFSKGGLQYRASTNTWRFANNQWDAVGSPSQYGMEGHNNDYPGNVEGSDNAYISSTYDGWIDLFGPGTSGYNGMHPWMTSTNRDDYPANDEVLRTNYDWGVYNAISNGGNQAGLWRYYSAEEYFYLRDYRPNHEKLFAEAIVHGMRGVILLPDDCALPEELVLQFNVVNTPSETEWAALEELGAVFLPANGCRIGTDIYDVGVVGYFFPFVESKDGSAVAKKVRLVQDVE